MQACQDLLLSDPFHKDTFFDCSLGTVLEASEQLGAHSWRSINADLTDMVWGFILTIFPGKLPHFYKPEIDPISPSISLGMQRPQTTPELRVAEKISSLLMWQAGRDRLGALLCRSANWGPRAKFCQPPAFVNWRAIRTWRTHLLTAFLHTVQSEKYLLPGPLQKNCVDPWPIACHLTPGPIPWGRVPESSAAVNKCSSMKVHVNYTRHHSRLIGQKWSCGSTQPQGLEVQSNFWWTTGVTTHTFRFLFLK